MPQYEFEQWANPVDIRARVDLVVSAVPTDEACTLEPEADAKVDPEAVRGNGGPRTQSDGGYEIPSTVNFGGGDDPDAVPTTYDATESVAGGRPYAERGQPGVGGVRDGPERRRDRCGRTGPPGRPRWLVRATGR